MSRACHTLASIIIIATKVADVVVVDVLDDEVKDDDCHHDGDAVDEQWDAFTPPSPNLPTVPTACRIPAGMKVKSQRDQFRSSPETVGASQT